MKAAVHLAPQSPAWLDRRWSCSRDVRHLSIGERQVLFCERSQQLFELNQSAAGLWASLADGMTPRAVLRTLEAQGIPIDQAIGHLADSISRWMQTGMLAPTNATRRLEQSSDCRVFLQVDTCSFSIALYSVTDETRDEIRRVFGQFECEERRCSHGLSIVHDDAGHLLFLEQRFLGLFQSEMLVPQIKAIITDQIARSAQAGTFLLHAALLVKNGNGLLLSGSPGAGKTTLAVALMNRGFDYRSDDIVKISPAGELSGIGFSPGSKSGAWDLISEVSPTLSSLPIHLRQDGQEVRYLSVQAEEMDIAETMRWVMVLERRQDAATTLEPLDPLDALVHCLAGAYAQDKVLRADTLEALSKRFSHLECRRLIYSDALDASATIEDVFGG